MKIYLYLLLIAFFSGAPLFADEMPRSSAPDDAEVYFVEPFDGDVISDSEVYVIFGLSGMGVAPAGIEMKDTGHHHLLIDVDEIDLDKPIPSDANHKHFGGGQTETVIELEPGEHTLQLILADHLHIPHDPPVMSEVITIIVE